MSGENVPIYSGGKKKLRVLGFPEVEVPEVAMRMASLIQDPRAEVAARVVDCGDCPVNMQCISGQQVLYYCKNCGATGPHPLDEARTITMIVHCHKHRFKTPTEAYDLGAMSQRGYFDRCIHCSPEATQYELQIFDREEWADPQRGGEKRLIGRMSTPIFLHVLTVHGARDGGMKVGGGEYIKTPEKTIRGTWEERRDFYESTLSACEQYTVDYNKQLEAEMKEIPSLKDQPPPRVDLSFVDPLPIED